MQSDDLVRLHGPAETLEVEGPDLATVDRPDDPVPDPLRDEDRWGWLDAIAIEIGEAERQGETLIIACSALKHIYRDRLRLVSRHLRFVYLEVGRDVAAARVASRKGHFMPASLIDSQFADLEPPTPDEQAVRLDATRDPAWLAAYAVSQLVASASPDSAVAVTKS